MLSLLYRILFSILLLGRDVAEAVSRRLPTAMVRVRTRLKSCEICGVESDTAAGFLRVLWLLLPFIHSSNCTTISTIYLQGEYNRPIYGLNNSGLSATSTP
jgi:hypothetical protein